MAQNYGANAAKNYALARATGYTGDFGNNAYQTWLAQQPQYIKDISSNIVNQYNANRGQFETNYQTFTTSQQNPTAPQSFGQNQELNKLLAAQTGYKGDFGGNQFQNWLATQSQDVKNNYNKVYSAYQANAKDAIARYSQPSDTEELTSYTAGQVKTPELPQGSAVTPVLQQVQQNELLTQQPPIATTQAAQPGQITVPQAQGTTATATDNSAQAALAGITQNTGQMTPTFTQDVGQMQAAQGTVSPEATVQGQMSQLMNFGPDNIPEWAKGAYTSANEMLAAKNMAASTISGKAIVAALMQAALPIAAQDAQTYFQMDIKNLDNQQQTNLENIRMRQQNMLTDTSLANAAAQFNASSESQVQQFVATLVSQIGEQNATRRTAISQFNAAELNKLEAQNTNNQLQAQQFEEQLKSQINQFNSQMDFQRDAFNSQMNYAIDQNNVLWRRAVNTANTAAQNAANQTNAQNLYNMSISSQNQLWQLMADEMAWAFTASQNQIDRDFNLTMAANNRAFADDAQSDAWQQELGSFVLNFLLK